MNLRFDDDDRSAEPPRDVAGLRRAERDLAARHGHAMLRENRLRLVLVELHDVGKLLMLFACAEGRQHFSMLAGPACTLGQARPPARCPRAAGPPPRTGRPLPR